MRTNNTKGLLLYDNPARLLADQLAKGERIEGTLQNWTDEAVRHLRVLRQQRGKILVIERSPETTDHALAAFQSAFPGRQPPPEFKPLQNKAGEMLQQSIAVIAAQQDQVVARLLSELQASSAIQAAAHPTVTACLDRLSAELQQMKAQQKEDAETKDLLLQQIMQLQASLETTETKRKNVQSECAQCKIALEAETQRANALQAELDLVYHSTSWRISAPMRVAKRLVRK